MTKIRLTPILAALAVVCFLGPAFSQEDMEFISSDVFSAPRRPPAVFQHDLHNEKAEIEDCAVCHHGETEDGKMDMEETSEGTPCAECHPENPTNGKTPLMRAYHLQCVTCHMDKSAGPVACGQCHVNM